MLFAVVKAYSTPSNRQTVRQGINLYSLNVYYFKASYVLCNVQYTRFFMYRESNEWSLISYARHHRHPIVRSHSAPNRVPVSYKYSTPHAARKGRINLMSLISDSIHPPSSPPHRHPNAHTRI